MRHVFSRALLVCGLLSLLAIPALAQSNTTVTNVSVEAAEDARTSVESPEADDVRRQLREQREEINRLQAALKEQMRLIQELRARVEQQTTTTAPVKIVDVNAMRDDALLSPAPGGQVAAGNAPAAQLDERLKKVEEQAKKTSDAISKQLGSIIISGELRLRYESFYGQLNALPTSGNPATVGNELSTRQRFRLRARLGLRGRFGDQFDWGIRLTTGSFPDIGSANQTLTDFYSHKNFALDQAFLTYKPSAVPGLRLQGGKFRIPWEHTELTIDDDIQPEGFNEVYSRDFKGSTFSNLTLMAWQLPMLERASAFVLGPDGRVSLDQSGRNGRDLAMYGAQVMTTLAFNPRVKLRLAATDTYYSGTQFITPVQFFGGQIQFPVTVTIPANGTTPAQTVTAQVNVPRDFFVSGANLGVSTGTNNAVNRDGRLSSGFNLVDLIGRLELAHSKRFPVALIFNFVTNTQARDVVVAGPGGTNRLLPNNENNGYWAEIQAGKNEVGGDWLFGYTFMRIEKDAVLTPFNFSDTVQQSDVRAHRVVVSYTTNPNVTLSLTGLFSQRLNGLLGVFGNTPAGSLNGTTTRLQMDTTFRF